MAKVELNSLIERVKAMFGETPTDDNLSLLEDLTDTFTPSEPEDKEDWKAKYEENDASWRKRYMDRFNGKLEENPIAKEIIKEEKAENISIDDLFTVKE